MGANRYGARATGATLGIKSIWNSTGRAGGRPGKSLGNTSGKSRTIGTSFIYFSSDSASSFLGDICAIKDMAYTLANVTLTLLNMRYLSNRDFSLVATFIAAKSQSFIPVGNLNKFLIAYDHSVTPP
ncbi:hypothetical protein Tco_0002440 [Tanacetum coccineum]